MKAILGTFDLYCHEPHCVGEILSVVKSESLVRKHVLRKPDGKIIRAFGTKEEALAWAKRAGMDVSE